MKKTPSGTGRGYQGRAPTTAGRRRTIVLLVMCVGMFLVQLDVTVVNVALPSIGRDLGGGLSGLQWVVDAYSVTLAAFLLAGGALGDRRGHRRVVVAGLGLFGLASLLCASSPAAGVLIGARALQGVGAALLLPGTLAVVQRTFPGRAEQARALGIWAGVSALALPAGPLLGGFLVTATGWRAVFWLNVPLVAVAALATLRLVPGGDGTPEHRMDLPGAALAAAALGGIVYCAVAAGGDTSTVTVAVEALLSAVLLAGFIWRERVAPAPMVPPELFRRRAFSGANAVAAAMNFTGIGAVFVVTLYLQGVQRRGAFQAGLMMLPLFVPLAAGAPLTGRLVARFGPRPPMLAGLLLGVAGSLSLLAVAPDSGYLLLVPVLVGLGAGMGLLTAAVVAAALRAGPDDRPGLSSGVNNTARQAAGALGIAVLGSLVGDPAAHGSFRAGLHQVGLLCALLWAAAALLTVWSVPRQGAEDTSAS
ncbi:MFS transporter [Streptomyces sp. NPDC048385]|uniref:MFS transporter n=1 Tax=Streptomyces sp. NPDC048385 TaxID=3155145 RepID=UPI00342FBCA2